MGLVGGGKPLEWMRPLRPDGRRHPDRIGTYCAQFDHWNINAEPGFEYRHVSDHRGRVPQLARLGYEVCDSPAKGSYGTNVSPHYGRPPDSIQRDGDMILMRIPTAMFAKRREHKNQKADAQLTGIPFLDQARPGEESRDGRPIRFKIPGHGLEMKQGG